MENEHDLAAPATSDVKRSGGVGNIGRIQRIRRIRRAFGYALPGRSHAIKNDAAFGQERLDMLPVSVLVWFNPARARYRG